MIKLTKKQVMIGQEARYLAPNGEDLFYKVER